MKSLILLALPALVFSFAIIATIRAVRQTKKDHRKFVAKHSKNQSSTIWTKQIPRNTL